MPQYIDLTARWKNGNGDAVDCAPSLPQELPPNRGPWRTRGLAVKNGPIANIKLLLITLRGHPPADEEGYQTVANKAH